MGYGGNHEQPTDVAKAARGGGRGDGAAMGSLVLTASDARAQGLVRVTPLGSHDGELCVQDRAILFEDPTGVRILYDPGQTVDDTDPRLGEVHVMLLSHAHPDHIGERRTNRGGTCAAPPSKARSIRHRTSPQLPLPSGTRECD